MENNRNSSSITCSSFDLLKGIMLQRALSDNFFVSPRRKEAKERSKSPAYLRNTRTGERQVRRTFEEADELTEQKMERKAIMCSRLSHSVRESDELPLAKGSIIKSDTSTSQTTDDSFCSHWTSSVDSRQPVSMPPPIKGSNTTKTCRASRNAFILVSPNRTPMACKKKKSGRRISLTLDSTHFASLPNIGFFDEEETVDHITVESRGRKKDKESSKESKKPKKKSKKSSRSKSMVTPKEGTQPTISQKKKEKRNNSVGPATIVEKQYTSEKRGRSSEHDYKGVPRTMSHCTAAIISPGENFVTDGGHPVTVAHWKTQKKFKDEDRSSHSVSRVRATVDENGKIRRAKMQSSSEEDDSTSRASSQLSKSSRRSNKVRAAVSSSPRRHSSRPKLQSSIRSSSVASRSSMDTSSSTKRRLLLEREISELSQRSERSHGSTRTGSDFQINPIYSSDMQKEVDSLQEELLALKAEHSVGQADAAKANRDLRKTRLELQKCITERGEIRLKVLDQDQEMKKKDHKIEVLEKAIECQLDKVDELEEELRKVYEDMFTLESRITEMNTPKGVQPVQDELNLSNSQRRLDELKSKKEEDLESRSHHLEKESERFLRATPHEDINQLLQENKLLWRALQQQNDESSSIIQLKELHALPDPTFGNKEEVVDQMPQEMNRLRQQPFDQVEFEAAKEEVRTMQTKWDGAQRRNLILEEDIDHWKSVNCTLEEELDETKAQAAMWKAKYLAAACAAGPLTSIGRGSSETRSAADTIMARKDEDNDKTRLDGSQSSIASFWSKLTKPNSSRLTNQSFHSAASKEELVGN